MRPLRVLLAILHWDYGDPARGPSYEHAHFHGALAAMDGVQVEEFDYGSAYAAGGRDETTRQLRDAISLFRPDVLFTFLHEDELDPELLVELKGRRDLLTLNWFADDHWRFDDFTRHWAPAFDVCVTTSATALARYAQLSEVTVVRSQWGVNHHRYRPTAPRGRLGVTFVGQPHGNRVQIINRLRDEGVDVQAWGHGWPAGKLDEDEMIRVYSSSRISLNIPNSSGGSRRQRLRSALRGRRPVEQIKGRNFEVPACGGFQLSGPAEDLTDYFEPDREIVIYQDLDDLVELCLRYERDSDQREAIGEAAHRRTLAEHTYERRFTELFREIGRPIPT